MLIDLARRQVVFLLQGQVEEALVVAEVEVDLEFFFPRFFFGRYEHRRFFFFFSLLLLLFLLLSPSNFSTYLASVVQDKHLAVLKGRHRAGVGVEVGVCFFL